MPRSPHRAITLLLLGAATIVAPLRAAAQKGGGAEPALPPITIECATGLNPATCAGQAVQTDSIQRFELHLRVKDARGRGVAGAVVRLRATSGTIAGDSTVSVGLGGDVHTIWLRNRGTDAAGIGVEVHAPQGSETHYSAVRYVHLDVPKPAAPTVLAYNVTQTFPFAGFENVPLRRPMIVEIRERPKAAAGDTTSVPITNPAICQQQRIVFRGSAGTMIPDTAVPEIYHAGNRNSDPNTFYEGCRAQAEWSLGAGSGPREGRMSLVPAAGYTAAVQPPYRVDVRSRAQPRFVLGAVLRFDQKYYGRHDGDKVTYRVERLLPGGGTVAFDSVGAASVGVDTVKTTSTGVMVGISSAIPTPYTNWLTVIGGIDLTNPLRHQYLGLSLFRLADVPESFPIDVSAMAHFGTIDELRRPDDCRLQVSSISGRSPCETHKDWRPRGAALMLSIDAGTLLAEAIKKLGS